MAAKAGKHIFSEKPLGYTSEDIRPASEAVKASDVRFMTAFVRRWDTDAHARDVIRSGKTGIVSAVKYSSGDPEYPVKYQRDTTPGSLVKDLGVHHIDVARWLT